MFEVPDKCAGCRPEARKPGCHHRQFDDCPEPDICIEKSPDSVTRI
ncbi:MAG: hypothetical protein R3F51_08925 [Cyanobacteriota/Melainabacteria group bacterium]